MTEARSRRLAVVLGGGGLKGFAHIGVLRALDELGVQPAVWAGTSIGALISAARVGGMSVGEMRSAPPRFAGATSSGSTGWR